MEKECIKCSKVLSLTLFEKGRNACRKCRLAQVKLTREKKKVTDVKVETKNCDVCLKVKRADEFHKNNQSKDGLDKTCKECTPRYGNKRWKPSETKVGKTLPCSECNLEKDISLFRPNKKSVSGYYHTCSDCWKVPEPTREQIRIYEQRYKAKYPEKIKEKYRRKASKLQNKIKDRMRARITSALSCISYRKAHHTIDYLGCSIDYLKKWLEYQFNDDISWDNYSEWHIDHVTPCCAFDLSNHDDQMKAFHWTNLRPCLASENHEKSTKIIDSLIQSHKLLSEEFLKLNPLPTQPGNSVEGTE
jgi:hypothetical protein